MNSNNKGIIVGSGTVSAKIIAVGDGAEVNHINVEGFDSLTKDDILHLFMELKKILEEAELPEDTKTELIEDLSAVKTATDKVEPNKERALERLTNVAITLEKVSKSVESGQKIWQASKPILVKAAMWLGAVAGSHLLKL